MNKILIYSVTFYPHQGGMEKNSELLAEELLRISHRRVTLFTKSKLDGKKELNVPYTIIRSSSSFELINEVFNHDMIIINGGVSLPIAIAAVLFRKPFVPIFQMAEIHGKPINESKLKVGLKKQTLKLAKKVVGVSQACLDSRNISKDKGKVIYNPIDPFLEVFLEQNTLIPIDDRPIDLLFAGRMIEGKGIFIFLEALKLLDQQGLNFQVLFSGNGIDEEQFKNEVLNCKWNNVKIEFQDFVRGDALAQTYLKTKCMVLPSYTHTEGSPLSIAEALIFGCAIIHSDQPAMIEQTAEAGMSFESGNSQALAKLIHSLFENPDWNQVTARSLKRSAMFSSKLYQKKLQELIVEIK